jgi:type IV secretory pathway TraG/TraD family ATPase VirD4
VLDELASLNKLPQLHTAVTENRKYGNPVVLGFQGRSQMEKRSSEHLPHRLNSLQTGRNNCRPQEF